MYALSKSFLKPILKYRGEVYSMDIYTHGATVNIDMRIYGHEEFTGMYSAEYEIERADGKTTMGTIMNQPTKEATFLTLEKKAIEILEGENHYWE